MLMFIVIDKFVNVLLLLKSFWNFKVILRLCILEIWVMIEFRWELFVVCICKKKKGDLYYKNNVDDYFVFKLNLELGSMYCLKKKLFYSNVFFFVY